MIAIDLTNDVQVLAGTLYGEARGESQLGKEGVASVIVNRANYAKIHPRYQFGDGSICSACLAPWQFSSWNMNDPNRAIILALDFDNPDPILTICLQIADAAVQGVLVDPTKGANFYKTTVTPWPREWGPEVPPLCTIDHQQFYNLITEVPMA